MAENVGVAGGDLDWSRRALRVLAPESAGPGDQVGGHREILARTSHESEKALLFLGTNRATARLIGTTPKRRKHMGRGILLWLIGVPIPIIILLALFWH
jgi:hypothetical protein